MSDDKKPQGFSTFISKILYGIFIIMIIFSIMNSQLNLSIETTPMLWIFIIMTYALALFSTITLFHEKSKLAWVIVPIMFTFFAFDSTNTLFADKEYKIKEATIVDKKIETRKKKGTTYELIMHIPGEKKIRIKTDKISYYHYNEGDVVGLKMRKGYWNTIIIDEKNFKRIRSVSTQDVSND